MLTAITSTEKFYFSSRLMQVNIIMVKMNVNEKNN